MLLFPIEGEETPRLRPPVLTAHVWGRRERYMMTTTTYARILGAVGQALDLAGARSFAVRESDTGLLLELVDARGERITQDLSLADLVDLVNWAERASATPEPTIERRDEGILHRLLERRELAGVR
jgi:hypothetical protein